MTATMRVRPAVNEPGVPDAGDPGQPDQPGGISPAVSPFEPSRPVLTADRHTTTRTADTGPGALTAGPGATPDTAPSHRPGLVADPRWRIASFST